MVALQDAPVSVDPTPHRPRRSRLTVIGAGVVLAAAAATAGWLAPRLIAHPTQPSYLGRDAAVVAKDLNCAHYTKAATHDESVYRYHDQGTCSLDGTTVTITTFDRESDGDAFGSVMKAVIPILHPTWVGATYAAGPGWVLADSRNLTAAPAELAVHRLNSGATYVIPAAKH